jgi:hypothetical protein
VTAQKLLGAPTIGGGVPGMGVVVEGVKGGKKAPSQPKYTKITPKMGCFPHSLA